MRDVYAVDEHRVLLVATDRVSAFDVVMREPVPHKGHVLTQLTAWWLGRLDEQPSLAIRHHLLSADLDEIVAQAPSLAPALAPAMDWLAGRAMLCRRAAVVPVECVVRGYLSGSAWREYQARGTLAGEALPAGLRESDRLDPPVFSPATKAEAGHDENITPARMATVVGHALASELERTARALYEFGRNRAASSGLIVADTKFEFGLEEDRILLIDEVLTPDSSRFWPAETYRAGVPQPSLDKQPLRDYLERERRVGRWNGEAPPPPLPNAVVRATTQRYLGVFERLTGQSLDRVLRT